ncbi:hypothetical protein [Nonomuraea typhae]|uniref:Integrase n=1 Tax=Nonomuraea typhae TaxID=2603600 RepID=A0ABW7ZCF7_9ACTN
MLLRLAYLTVTNAFAALRLLPMSDRDKDVEILSLRHQVMVLQRQAAPLRAVPDPITEPARIIDLNIRRRDRLGGVLHEYSHVA